MKKKSTIFLLILFCATSPSLFATQHSNPCEIFETELHNLYPNLAQAHPHDLLEIDFKFLNILKSQYENLSFEESKTKDLEHNEALVPLASHWKTLFIQHKSEQGAFFAQEIQSHLNIGNVSLDWISLLPIRFCAAISSAPSQEEIDIYNDEIYENTISHTTLFKRECWGEHKSFKQTMDENELFKDIILFRPMKKTPTQLVPKVVLPIMNKNHLSIPDIVLMNLDNIFPIAVSFQSQMEGIHGTTTLTSLGFLLHDLFHSEISHSSFLQQVEEAPENTKAFLLKKHTLNTNMMKFLIRQKLQTVSGDFKDPHFRKMILTFFLGNHESDSWPEKIYRTTTLGDTVDILCNHLLENSESFQINAFEEEHKEDVIGSSVFDGMIYLSDDELFKRLRQYHLEIAEVSFSALKEIPGDFVLTKSDSNKIEYTATLDNKLTLCGSNPHRHIMVSNSYVNTLHYRLKNARSSHSFLRYAGLQGLQSLTVEKLLADRKIEDLSLSNIKASSAESILYLNALAQNVRQVTNDFKMQAHALLEHPDALFLHTQASMLTEELQRLGDVPFVQTP